MTLDPQILIVSTKADLATDAVVLELATRGVPVTRFNTEDYPFGLQLTTHINSIDKTSSWGRNPSRAKPTALWFRRVRTAPNDGNIPPGIIEFCRTEAYHHVLGAALTCGTTRAMSPPGAIWNAENKLVQLSTAADLGLRIPETVITNNPEEIRAAYNRSQSGLICKPVRTGHISDSTGDYAIFTSEVLEEHLASLETALPCPSIFQAHIRKRSDIRAVIVGDRIFAAEIDSQSVPAAVVDWRATDDPNIPHRLTRLPNTIESLIFELVRSLRLTFAAIDLILAQDNEYYFLEANPNGQWLWLEDRLDIGITRAVANWLIHHEGLT